MTVNNSKELEIQSCCSGALEVSPVNFDVLGRKYALLYSPLYKISYMYMYNGSVYVLYSVYACKVASTFMFGLF